MNWIKIEDELPKDDENIFCKHLSCNDINPVLGYYESASNLFFSLYSFTTCPLNITHWMRIPEIKDEK